MLTWENGSIDLYPVLREMAIWATEHGESAQSQFKKQMTDFPVLELSEFLSLYFFFQKILCRILHLK